jgi:hypothetical protein
VSVNSPEVTERDGISTGSIQQFRAHYPDCLPGYSPLNLEREPIDTRRHQVEGLSRQTVSPAASQFD